MKKNKLALKIVLAILIGCIIGGGVAWYFVDKDNFLSFVNSAWDVLNKPLPIISVSILTICGFIFSFLKYSDVGKKGNLELKKRYDDLLHEKDNIIAEKDNLITKLDTYKQQVNELNNTINQMIDILPHKKLKELKHEENNEREN